VEHVWTCGCCGKQFRGLPLDFAWHSPDQWFALPEEERWNRGRIDENLCKLDEEHFVRGVLEVSVLGIDDCYRWGLWVSVSKEDFRRVLDLWDAPIDGSEPPIPGRLCNNMAIYPTTFGLEVRMRLRDNNLRPTIELLSPEHPLAIEQRNGISVHRVDEIFAELHSKH